MSKTKIPALPGDVTWTEDQWKAIWAKDQDILVAAAAGSGKTAVLVNRIIQKVISEEDPIDVDELLVVTFTNASAAEMRHRVSEALEKAINDNPHSQHLRKQLSLINRASISTLHSFCLEVIRKYYYLTDIDPGFRIADSTEIQLLRDEVMEELFEEQYGQSDNEEFFNLVDAFTSDRNDDALQNIVRSLHDFSQSNPNPDRWLDGAASMYELADDDGIDDLSFIDSLKFDIGLQLDTARDLLERSLALTKTPGGPAPRAENYIADLALVAKLSEVKDQSWNALYEEIQNVKFGTAKRLTGADFIKEVADEATKYRDKAKKIIKSLQEELFSRKPESYLRDIRELKGYVDTLVMLVKRFDERFFAAKAEKNLVDFADLEHYCLQILTGETMDGERKPSAAAIEYRNQFKEVLVDEYQDTNLVQESILKLVTADGEYDGNLFMVGDVKQSIYRFRLAEPNLFLGKYTRFTHDGVDSGLKIDLNRNFRSRKEVLDGTNFLFQQLMGITVGEIDYDEDAQLKKGAPYPEDDPNPIELHLIDGAADPEAHLEVEGYDGGFEAEELEKAQLEARQMAKLIKKAISEKHRIYDTKTKRYRSATYRDMVILLRSMPWAPQIMEEFKKQGIPVYANLSTGYFEATEVAIMISLLKVIDNPQQDIPLASVLRSPIVGLDEEEMSKVRLFHTGSYYEALADFYRKSDPEEHPGLYEKASAFYKNLVKWRKIARQEALSDLIWLLYRETQFYDFAGGMPGGKQRQANLRALYDRARQYEASSFRGLFRFLRFIERMQERGDDLGAARALGEQEDVVRLMTIHSSKGLEFPIVFIAGLSKQFNMMDLRKSYLLDKDYGFAAKYVNSELRITYPSLPQLAFKKKKQLELIAEEMRVLYVALTRAKEKLYLIASINDAEKTQQNWESNAAHGDWLLKDYVRAGAKSYLDWIGPSLVRHRDSLGAAGLGLEMESHPSNWSISVIPSEELAVLDEEEALVQEQMLEHVQKSEKVGIVSEFYDDIKEQLEWEYPEHEATVFRSKQSVSELKRQYELKDEQSSTELLRKFKRPITKRPTFMQEKSLTPAERGTITHLVMQHIDLSKEITIQSIQQLIIDLIQRELLTEEQKEAVDPETIVDFFDSEIGQRIQRAKSIRREVPFTMSLPAKEAYSDWTAGDEEVLIQGVIDCIFEDEQGLVLLDYKTDTITGRFANGYEGAKGILADRYQMQLQLYTRAVEGIVNKKVTGRYLFFFDGSHLLEV
ncbi:helicase-exonuclease AddAB subunit AddA [Peribacillus simplex]|uniref:helicase-exonuclease AddAB subunit AddA n=1 Tax=Peribacillus TaxID=2675229 RepID=UPI001924B578|nr:MULTISPECIES: helicase-exonuclease AddAB subunit AddA [Peribacillus]MBD8591323.1 helicase-exonuclease AddAB subunit AddA [Peribacillus simplex]MCP1097226.1 helicase-exonuclease AddAB subunit AddA [Bacillaceae bacterium OS4b]MCT1391724.1 helicase-exonuclease AddAB subunit AddA [Peribacillus frigoritolerans]MEA3577726.1 helicase-exonuclease AddAB subunit AddA [Peribacillus frigoritolerans]